MPFFFLSVFLKMVACVVHQEGLWKTSRGKCLKCVRKAEEKDWSGKVFLSSRFFFGSFAGYKITYLKVVVEGWEIMWKTWFTVQREIVWPVLRRWYRSTFAMGVFLGFNVRERVTDMSFNLTTCRKCLSEKPEKLVDTGNNGRLVSKRCFLVILKQFLLSVARFLWFRRSYFTTVIGQENVRLLSQTIECPSCFCFALLRSVIGPENWRHHLIQWNGKLKLIPTWSLAFSRALIKQIACFYFEFIIG